MLRMAARKGSIIPRQQPTDSHANISLWYYNGFCFRFLRWCHQWYHTPYDCCSCCFIGVRHPTMQYAIPRRTTTHTCSIPLQAQHIVVVVVQDLRTLHTYVLLRNKRSLLPRRGDFLTTPTMGLFPVRANDPTVGLQVNKNTEAVADLQCK